MNARNTGAGDGRTAVAVHTAANLLPRLVRQALTAQGVPTRYGGAGTSVAVAAEAVKAVMAKDPAAGGVLTSQLATLQLLLACRNVALREHCVPQLVSGEVFGIWPGGAMEALVERNNASVMAHDTGRGMRLSGALGRVIRPGHARYLMVCPVSWSPNQPPGLALLDGDQDGLSIVPHDLQVGGVAAGLAALENVFFRDDEWLDADASGLALGVMMGDLRGPLSILTQGML